MEVSLKDAILPAIKEQLAFYNDRIEKLRKALAYYTAQMDSKAATNALSQDNKLKQKYRQ